MNLNQDEKVKYVIGVDPYKVDNMDNTILAVFRPKNLQEEYEKTVKQIYEYWENEQLSGITKSTTFKEKMRKAFDEFMMYGACVFRVENPMPPEQLVAQYNDKHEDSKMYYRKIEANDPNMTEPMIEDFDYFKKTAISNAKLYFNYSYTNKNSKEKNITEYVKEEFEKCKDFVYWFNNYYK